MSKTAKRSGLSVVSGAKSKAASGDGTVVSRTSGALRIVKPETGTDTRAPYFIESEIAQLTALVIGMRTCDAGNDLEFQLFMQRGSLPEATGLQQRDVATELLIKPMTLQRWCRGEHLPYPLPRRAYLDTLADLVDRRIATVQAHGIEAILATPRRGARKASAS